MAVTKIWKIKHSFAAPLKYIENEEKTANPKAAENYQMLDDVIEYAAREDKTEQKFFVSSLNCDREHARDEFLLTKKRFDKEDGIACFHAYQSFAEENLSPEEAHEIGIAFAEEMWGDRFQVVIATHLNTCHVHNHFIVNSVSFLDGKKYHDSRAAYRRMREVSDRLCREHGLSVIEHPEGKGGSYYLNQLERAGMPTRYNVARQAIDEAISRSVNMEEFRHEMKMMGYHYQFSPSRRYWTITPAGWDRPIRLYRLGAEYTEERIRQRVYENDISIRERRLAKAAYYPNRYNLRRRVDRIMGRSGLEKLYLRYCYELGYLPKYNQKPARLHPLLREDLLKCEMYSQQARLLCRNGIETEADLLLHMEKIRRRSKEILQQRQDLQRLVRRKTASEDEKTQAKEEIANLSGQLKNLRKEMRLCENIMERSHQLEDRLAAVDRDRDERKRVRER
ncbi:MAG: relaxase/mobilization nuclease domain-containing protein [Firmicutes bacterium]|nr:relaxase/mobilization nuclease domain-containing protein [Bacillota bacterium]